MSSKLRALKPTGAGACGAVVTHALPNAVENGTVSAATTPNGGAAPASARNASISVAAAEIEATKKRGRPRTRNDTAIDFINRRLGERQRRELTAALHGLHLLGNVRGCEWICSREAMVRGVGKSWRPGIVAELGRLSQAGWSDDEVIAIAQEIAIAKPKTKDIVARLRALRVAPREADPWRLTETLARTLDDYVNRYPTTTDEQVFHALQLTQQAWLERHLCDREESAS